MLRVKADCHTPNCLVIHLGFNNLRPLNVPGMIFFYFSTNQLFILTL